MRSIDPDLILLVTLEQCADMLNLSRAKVYQLADCDGLPTTYFGKSRRVPVDALKTWLNERIAAEQQQREPIAPCHRFDRNSA